MTTRLALLFAFVTIAGSVAVVAQDHGVVRTMMVRDELIMRIPVKPRMSPAIEWKEKRGPKCIPAHAVAGAVLSGKDSIDLVMRNRQRVRAKMDDDCPALDFYGGFYLQPEDGQICAKREMFRSRMGASCRIEKFRLLVPHIKD